LFPEESGQIAALLASGWDAAFAARYVLQCNNMMSLPLAAGDLRRGCRRARGAGAGGISASSNAAPTPAFDLGHPGFRRISAM
jgi:hypothetical protein